jgi:hypothetical protein
VSGDVQAKIAVYDEKIKTERENIDAARKALSQMDAQVNERLSRSTDDRGAERAVQIRRQQQAERTRLQNDISKSQGVIARLNEERAPIAAEVRKVEAEVGPIKYIANFIYGDNPDTNVLEKAVTWVIIIIVIVFDPLAVILLLASQYSFQWFRQAREDETTEGDSPTSSESEDPPTVTTDEDTLPEAEERHSEYTPAVPMATQYIVAEDVNDEPIADIKEAEEKEDHEILETATISEAAAMTAWKHDHPDSSLKIQRRLLERGIIDHLPWEDYLKPRADFHEMTDREVAEEAAKWAAEKLEERPGDYLPDSESKKNAVTWMENEDGHQVKKTLDNYEQNAEQSERTLWQRIQDSKK